MTFNPFVLLCNYHLYLVSKNCHHSQRKHHTYRADTLFPIPSSPQQAPIHSVSMNFIVLDISCTWNQIIWETLGSASFLSKIYLRFIHIVAFFSIFLWLNNLLLHVQSTFIHSSMDKQFRCFHILDI